MRYERRHELAVDQVREHLIVVQLVGVGADCALVCFFNDV